MLNDAWPKELREVEPQLALPFEVVPVPVRASPVSGVAAEAGCATAATITAAIAIAITAKASFLVAFTLYSAFISHPSVVASGAPGEGGINMIVMAGAARGIFGRWCCKSIANGTPWRFAGLFRLACDVFGSCNGRWRWDRAR
jgi:hypothetical protein